METLEEFKEVIGCGYGERESRVRSIEKKTAASSSRHYIHVAKRNCIAAHAVSILTRVVVRFSEYI